LQAKEARLKTDMEKAARELRSIQETAVAAALIALPTTQETDAAEDFVKLLGRYSPMVSPLRATPEPGPATPPPASPTPSMPSLALDITDMEFDYSVSIF
jgi:hypothetical protein